MPNRFTIEKRGGYDVYEVDEYIEKLESVVKSYKDKDAAIKNAILSAQVAADSIIRNAKNRSFEMKENAVKRIQEIVTSIAEQKQMLKSFQDEYNRQIAKYLHDFNEKDIAAITKKIEALENYLTKYTENDVDAPSSDAPVSTLASAPLKQDEPIFGDSAFGGSSFGSAPSIDSTLSSPSSSSSFFDDKDDLLSFGEKKNTSLLSEKEELNNIFNLD